MNLLPQFDGDHARTQINELVASGKDMLVRAIEDGSKKNRFKLAEQGTWLLSTATYRAIQLALFTFGAEVVRAAIGVLPDVSASVLRAQELLRQDATAKPAPAQPDLGLGAATVPRVVAVYAELKELAKQLNTCTSAAAREELGARFAALRGEYVQLHIERDAAPPHLGYEMGPIGRAARERLGLVLLDLELADEPPAELVQLRDKLQNVLINLATMDAHAEVDRLVL